MPDLEKVIKGLECCIIRYSDDHARCDECPYESACGKRLKQDALALLKAQEPRVMTLDEVHSAGEHNDDVFGDYYGIIVWVEEKNMNPYQARIRYSFCPEYGDDEDDDKVVCASFGSDCDNRLHSKFYGATWRCWTSRPTEKQREATPWQSDIARSAEES